jgi:hypothetical protein
MWGDYWYWLYKHLPELLGVEVIDRYTSSLYATTDERDSKVSQPINCELGQLEESKVQNSESGWKPRNQGICLSNEEFGPVSHQYWR